MAPHAADQLEHVEVRSSAELWQWFATHHAQHDGIWLVTYKKHVTDRHITHDDVLDALIAHGWCDGIARRIDDDRVKQLVSPRRTQPWAKSYKDRAERLCGEGRMHPAGQAVIDRAKDTGDWDRWDDVDRLLVPEDLRLALDAAPPADDHFAAFPPSTRRSILRWIASAKTDVTRQKRISLTVAEARSNRRVKSHG